MPTRVLIRGAKVRARVIRHTLLFVMVLTLAAPGALAQTSDSTPRAEGLGYYLPKQVLLLETTTTIETRRGAREQRSAAGACDSGAPVSADRTSRRSEAHTDASSRETDATCNSTLGPGGSVDPSAPGQVVHRPERCHHARCKRTSKTRARSDCRSAKTGGAGEGAGRRKTVCRITEWDAAQGAERRESGESG
jgi:hypothetical protein